MKTHRTRSTRETASAQTWWTPPAPCSTLSSEASAACMSIPLRLGHGPAAAQHGQVAPDDFLTTLAASTPNLPGAVGWPARLPNHVTLTFRIPHASDLKESLHVPSARRARFPVCTASPAQQQ